VYADAGDEPAARLFHKSIIMVRCVKEVVGLYIEFPLVGFPCKSGISQEIRFVVQGIAFKVGIRAHPILPSGGNT
jgi:hypothetical protein